MILSALHKASVKPDKKTASKYSTDIDVRCSRNIIHFISFDALQGVFVYDPHFAKAPTGESMLRVRLQGFSIFILFVIVR